MIMFSKSTYLFLPSMLKQSRQASFAFCNVIELRGEFLGHMSARVSGRERQGQHTFSLAATCAQANSAVNSLTRFFISLAFSASL